MSILIIKVSFIPDPRLISILKAHYIVALLGVGFDGILEKEKKNHFVRTYHSIISICCDTAVS